MRLPIVSSFNELHGSAQRFALFTLFNVVSWQCIVGPALVLFARKMDMPASLVGFLLSFLPLSMLFIVFTIHLVDRIGSKQLMARTWLCRNLIVLGVFLLPWLMNRGGQKAAWAVLIAVTLAFCIIRAVGAGSWFPWLHEIVPEHQRGAYFSMETTIAQFVNVVVLLGQGFILSGDPSVARFLWIYGIGIVAGLISLVWMWRIPGGEATGQSSSVVQSFGACRRVLRRGTFFRFVVVMSLCFSATSWLGAAVVLYMRDVLGLSAQTIMIASSVGSAAVLFTIRSWGRFADQNGSARTIFLALSAHAVCACLWLLLFPGASWTFELLIVLLVGAYVFGAAFGMAANRAMLCQIQSDYRPAYTAIWTVGTSLAMGLTPIAAGFLVEHWGEWGFRACFLISGALGLSGAAASLWVVADGEPIQRPFSLFLNPQLPVRVLYRIVWISLGLDDSSRRSVVK